MVKATERSLTATSERPQPQFPDRWSILGTGGPPLARFDADLDTYDPTVSIGERPVFGLVDTLGRQAALADHLAKSGIGTDWTALTHLMRSGDPRFLELQGLCESRIEGHDEGLVRAGLHWPNCQSGWTGAAARMLHERIMGCVLPAEALGRYRREDAGLDAETGLAGLPVSVMPEQMRVFRHIFSSKLWLDCHPIIRAGLGHLHLLRTRPFEHGNGDVARLLLTMLLESRGVPELPLDLILAARRADYRTSVRAALLVGDIAGFLRFLIEACHAALHLGQDMAVRLRVEIERLRAVMAQIPTGIVEVEILAVPLCSRLVARHRHVVFASHADGDRRTAKRLINEPGTPAFFDEIRQLNGETPPKPRAGTLGVLITACRGSPEFLGRADATRADYQEVFDWLKNIDDIALVQIDSALVIGIRDKAFAKHERRFANYVVQVLRLLLGWGVPRGWFQTNVAKGVPLIRRPKGLPKANRPWTDQEVEAVLSECPINILPGIALGVFAGVSIKDAIVMPWSSYDGERLCFSRGKTAVPVDLPGHERLKSILRETPRLSPIIVTTTKGNPYSPDGFSGAFRNVIKALEVSGKVAKGLTVHGLCHTVGSRLADAGATTREIMAFLGHETEAMAQHYTRGADRRRNATAAIRKLEGGRKG